LIHRDTRLAGILNFVARLAAFLGTVALTAVSPVSAQQSSPRPHIIYIVADDLGWKDVGFHGSEIRTPNIDKLAQNGARLEQFYVQPMCTPTRAALLTGRYPFRYGLQTAVIPTPSKYGLPTDEWLLPQALKEAGYNTLMVGKWHLGHSDRKYWPRQRGFDYHYGSMVGEVDYFTHASANVKDWFRNNQPVKETGYVTKLWGNDAVAQINAHDPKTPLFLYLAFTAPHAPYQAPKEYLAKYKNIEDPTRRAYAAMITAMDDEIGNVVAALEKRGMRDNTLIVFMSDNGGNRTAMLSGDVDVSTLKSGFVSSGEHMPVSQDSHNVCRSLTVLARRCGQDVVPAPWTPAIRCHSPEGCPGGRRLHGFAALRRSLVTPRQGHCRAARRSHDTGGATSRAAMSRGTSKSPRCPRPCAMTSTDRRRTEVTSRAGGRRVIAGAWFRSGVVSSRPLRLVPTLRILRC